MTVNGAAALMAFCVVSPYLERKMPASQWGNDLMNYHFHDLVGIVVAALIMFTGHAIWLPAAMIASAWMIQAG